MPAYELPTTSLKPLVKERVRRFLLILGASSVTTILTFFLIASFKMFWAGQTLTGFTALMGWVADNLDGFAVKPEFSDKTIQFASGTAMALFLATALKERNSRDPEHLSILAVLDGATFWFAYAASPVALLLALTTPAAATRVSAIGTFVLTAFLAALTPSNPDERARRLRRCASREARLEKLAVSLFGEMAKNRTTRYRRVGWRDHQLFYGNSMLATLILSGISSAVLITMISESVVEATLAAMALTALLTCALFPLVGWTAVALNIIGTEHGRRRPWMTAVLWLTLTALTSLPYLILSFWSSWRAVVGMSAAMVMFFAPLILAVIWGFSNRSRDAQMRYLALLRSRAESSTEHQLSIQAPPD